MTLLFRERETVVLLHDAPDAGLRAGDLGAVVHVHAADALEVEFVTALGRTQALVTLRADDVRAVADTDLLAVRPGRSDRGAASPAVAPDSRRTDARSAHIGWPRTSEVESPHEHAQHATDEASVDASR